MTGGDLTLVVNLSAGALLCIALYRRPQAICVTLALAYVLAIGLTLVLHGAQLRPLLLFLDAGVVISMSALFALFNSDRARIVATIGALKIITAIATAVMDWPWASWAAANNALFFAQILVAGGMADGILAWVGYRTIHLVAVRSRGRQNVAGS